MDKKTTEAAISTFTPYAQYQVVDVVFPAGIATDLKIRHTLQPDSPYDVCYQVLKQYTPGVVYENQQPGRAAWPQGFIILRSDTASWSGKLLLGVLRDRASVGQ